MLHNILAHYAKKKLRETYCSWVVPTGQIWGSGSRTNCNRVIILDGAIPLYSEGIYQQSHMETDVNVRSQFDNQNTDEPMWDLLFAVEKLSNFCFTQ